MIKIDDSYIDKDVNFRSNYTLQHRITPNTFYKTGYQKTNTDDINSIYIDYPIQIISPNSIVIDSNQKILNFVI